MCVQCDLKYDYKQIFQKHMDNKNLNKYEKKGLKFNNTFNSKVNFTKHMDNEHK